MVEFHGKTSGLVGRFVFPKMIFSEVDFNFDLIFGVLYELLMQKKIDNLVQLRHPSLVSLVGYCTEEYSMMLVYEFMPHGHLSDHLFTSNFSFWMNIPSMFFRCNSPMILFCGNLHSSIPIITLGEENQDRYRYC